MNKTCSKCKQELPLNEFYEEKKSKDGLRRQCKKCIAERSVKYRKIYKKEIAKWKTEYNKTHKKEIAEYNKTHVIQIAGKRYRKNVSPKWVEKLIQLRNEHGFNFKLINKKLKRG